MAIFFIDLDNFKQINDSYGHKAGDELLKTVAKRLKKSIRETDTASRLSGDEFTVLLPGISNDFDINQIANRILNSLKEVFPINNQELSITASLGISIYPADSNIPDELLKFADIAMYKAKEKGKNNFQYFDMELQSELTAKSEKRMQLKSALDNKEFMLYFQPILNIFCLNIIPLKFN